MIDTTAPEGRISRPDLATRGWNAEMMTHLTDVQTAQFALDLVDGGITLEHYAMTEIEHLEASNPTIAKAVEAHRTLIPRTYTPLTSDQTWNKATLHRRGWTDSHITRLLGAPDRVEPGLYGRSTHQWAISRVEQAEATDAKLRERLAKYREAQEAQRQARINQTMDAGHAVWHRDTDGAWVAQGRHLQLGQIITIARRDGSSDTHQVTEVLTTNDNGLTTARVRRYDATAEPRTMTARA